MDHSDEPRWDQELVARIAKRLIAEPGEYFVEATAARTEPNAGELAASRAERFRGELIAHGVGRNQLLVHAREGREGEPRSLRVVNAEGVGPGHEEGGAIIYVVYIDR